MRKESTSSQNSPTFNCLICKEDRKFVSIGLCNHRRICLYCIMRARLFYDENKCPICNTNLDEIYILDFSNKITYEEIIKEKDLYYKDDEFDKCKIYYTEMDAKEEALKLRGFNCPIKNCRSETFENLENLNEHLNKVHRRYYCNVCLNENKKFLSEMEIYNEQNLQEHIEFGEYKDGILISPPHPSCPFENNMKFYNDEQLFKHMNNNHFICQYCRNEKNIIFYYLLDNLLQHYQKNHYCCPFKECIQDVYVVFGKEEELISHLITKHHVQNATDRLKEIIIEHKGNFKTFTPLSNGKDEFNFTKYIEELKKKSEQYKKDVVNNRNRYVTLGESHFNDEGIEVIYEYNNNKRGNGGKKGKNKREYYNKFNQNNYNNNYNYNNYNNYNNQNNYNNYNDQKNYYNKKKNNNQNNYRNNYNHKKNNYNNNNNTNKYYNDNNDFNNKRNNYNYYNENNKRNNNENKQYQKESEFNEIENQVKNIYITKETLNYSEIISFYLNSIKNYIKTKIINEKISDQEVMLAKETIFQLIIIIDKMDSPQKLIELTSLHNFGIDLGINKQLKELLSSGIKNNKKFYEILEKLETLKKILLVYKYLLISYKKIEGLFYKLDLEQIDPDLYEEFLERPKKQNENMSKIEKEKRERQIKLKQEMENQNYLYSNNLDNKNKNQKKEDKKINFNPQKKSKNKLAMLLEGNEEEDNKDEKNNKKKNIGGFNLSNFNLDIDFPELK